jgi:hypothetical protein
MNRRTLYRVLAVAVALAAISPLLLDSGGGLQQFPSCAADLPSLLLGSALPH